MIHAASFNSKGLSHGAKIEEGIVIIREGRRFEAETDDEGDDAKESGNSVFIITLASIWITTIAAVMTLVMILRRIRSAAPKKNKENNDKDKKGVIV